MEYIFYVRQLGSIRLFPVFFGAQSTTPELILPVGTSWEEYGLDAVIRIFDSVGDYAEFVFLVKVSSCGITLCPRACIKLCRC